MLRLLRPSASGSRATCLATRSDETQGKWEGASGTSAGSELHSATAVAGLLAAAGVQPPRCKDIAPGVQKGHDSYPPASNFSCKHCICGDLSVTTIGGSCTKLSSLAFLFTCSHLTLVFPGSELCEAAIDVSCVSLNKLCPSHWTYGQTLSVKHKAGRSKICSSAFQVSAPKL